MKKKKSKTYDTVITICPICDAVLYYNEDCGCLECIICEQINKINDENKQTDNTMGQDNRSNK